MVGTDLRAVHERRSEMTDKERFCEILKATGRLGVDKVLAGLEELGFFAAPASTRFHGSEPGGLLKHSLNVYDQARVLREVEVKMCPAIEPKVPVESIAITALLHDVCKAEVYKEVEKFRKDKDNQWEKYKTYTVDYSFMPLGHGEKSVIRLLRWGLEMTDAEVLAIRWHMQAFDLSDSPESRASYSQASMSCPLLAILIAADGLASRLMEGCK